MADDAYVLEPQPLRDEHVPLCQGFRCGDEFWEQDVEDYLATTALDWQRRGYNKTTLFFLPDFEGIAAYMTAAPKALLRDGFPKARELPKRERPNWREIPAVYLAYAGVHRGLQGLGLGKELHTRLLRGVRDSPITPRWLYLHVYADNPAAKGFWARRGYQYLDIGIETPRRGSSEKTLLTLVLDLRGRDGDP